MADRDAGDEMIDVDALRWSYRVKPERPVSAATSQKARLHLTCCIGVVPKGGRCHGGRKRVLVCRLASICVNQINLIFRKRKNGIDQL